MRTGQSSLTPAVLQTAGTHLQQAQEMRKETAVLAGIVDLIPPSDLRPTGPSGPVSAWHAGAAGPATAAMVNAWAETTEAEYAPVPGEIVRMVIHVDVDPTTGDLVFDLYLNGAATGITGTIVGGSGVLTKVVEGVVGLAAGDAIQMQFHYVTGVPVATNAEVTLYGRYYS